MVTSELINGERAKVKEMPDFIKRDTVCFDEFIQKPKEADLILNLIIQYEDLFNTLNVKIAEGED